MNINHRFEDIPEDDPFANDKLDREKIAKILTSLIKSYSNGFVLSINGQWGTGKTTFIKMWQLYLVKDKFTTIYFNAWENDFESNPLVALLAELGAITRKEGNTFNSLLKKASILSKSVVPALIKGVASKYIDKEIFTEALGKIAEGAMDIFKEEVDEYVKKKESLNEFRKELEKYVSNNIDQKPLVLFIDELDRCRPNYAVELLEKVKHLFNVPGIVFVLSIDKIQLGNAIKGFYGSENIDSSEYLRRFIDLEFSLPAPNTEIFCSHLYRHFDFDGFFKNPQRPRSLEIAHDGRYFLEFAILLFSRAQTTLRQQEKIMARARVALNSFAINYYVLPVLFLYLLYAREFYPSFYKKLTLRQEKPEQILIGFKETLPHQIGPSDESYDRFMELEVLLAATYDKFFRELHHSSEPIVTERDRLILNIKPALDSTTDGSKFLSFYSTLIRTSIQQLRISHLFEKIDLLESFVTSP
ncbi:P-loop NTPase fold protein [Chitinophaga sp. 212800010-3]|uniref:KAP family P-loop NTPase fold protein n=1 Tax=unclassified Chitinophaga TaxID=2619133 RepID=UPI002DF06CA3|nr:KAP NTPase domain-containing protein [Chitinophaga sp. 212800010-3]